MKKLLFLCLLCISIQAHAGCLIHPVDVCSKDILCPAGSMLATYGECVDCNSEKRINIYCIGIDKAKLSCPNRFYEGNSCAGFYSYLECPKGFTVNCDEIKDKKEQEICKKEKDNKRCYLIGHDTNEKKQTVDPTVLDGDEIILDDDNIIKVKRR